MIIYPLLLASSLAGFFILLSIYYKEIRTIPETELRLRLKASPSNRNKAWNNIIYPAFLKIKEMSAPFLIKLLDHILTRAQRIVEKLEGKLSHVAKMIHGKAINLEILEKSEYWKKVNGEQEEVEKSEEVITDMKEETKVLNKKGKKPA